MLHLVWHNWVQRRSPQNNWPVCRYIHISHVHPQWHNDLLLTLIVIILIPRHITGLVGGPFWSLIFWLVGGPFQLLYVTLVLVHWFSQLAKLNAQCGKQPVIDSANTPCGKQPVRGSTSSSMSVSRDRSFLFPLPTLTDCCSRDWRARSVSTANLFGRPVGFEGTFGICKTWNCA